MVRDAECALQPHLVLSGSPCFLWQVCGYEPPANSSTRARAHTSTCDSAHAVPSRSTRAVSSTCAVTVASKGRHQSTGTSGTSPPTPPTQALASSSVVDVPDEDGNVPREGHFLAFVIHGEPRENIRVAECVDYRGSKITVWHYVDVSSGFDLRKPLQVRKLAGEHGAGPDTHGNYRNGIVDPVGQGLRNFYRLEATYNVGGTKGVSTSDEHGTVDIIVDRFMLEVRGKYGYVPPPVCRLVSEWLERPSHKAACSDVPDAEKRELFYTQNMAAANAILPFPRPVLGDGPRNAPRRSGAAPESSSRLRPVDFLGKTSVTLDIAQYATDLGYCTTRDDVPIRQEGYMWLQLGAWRMYYAHGGGGWTMVLHQFRFSRS